MSKNNPRGLTELMAKNDFSCRPDFYSFMRPVEASASFDMPVNQLESLGRDIKEDYGPNAHVSYIEMMADLMMHTPEFGAPIMVQTICYLPMNDWEYYPGIRLHAEVMERPSSRAQTFENDTAKALSRRWLYDGFLVNHLDDMTTDTRAHVQAIFQRQPA